MPITESFGSCVKNTGKGTNPHSEDALKALSKHNQRYSKFIILAALLIFCTLSGCNACKATGEGIATWWEEKLEEGREQARADREGRPRAHLMVQ